MDLENIELHDALLEKIEMSVGKISISMLYYPDGEKSKDWEPLLLEFIDVQESNLLINHSLLHDHKIFGNVIDWSPDCGGVTYIYLTGGCISVKAKTLNVLFPNQ